MFTIQSHTEQVDKVARRRIVTVTFVDGAERLVRGFEFSIESDVSVIKKAVNDYLSELNVTLTAITDFIPGGEVTPVEPTAAELEFNAWKQDRADLKKLKELVEEGIIAAATPQQITLQNRVNTGWKNAYFNQI